MKTPKTYRFSPSTLTLLEMLKAEPKFATCTETEIIEIAIMYLYANGTNNTEAGD